MTEAEKYELRHAAWAQRFLQAHAVCGLFWAMRLMIERQEARLASFPPIKCRYLYVSGIGAGLL